VRLSASGWIRTHARSALSTGGPPVAQVHAVHADAEEAADVDGADPQVSLDGVASLVGDVAPQLLGAPAVCSQTSAAAIASNRKPSSERMPIQRTRTARCFRRRGSNRGDGGW